jgi:hypothetical protein
MTTSGFMIGGRGEPKETAAEKAARLERERALLELGREDIRAGRCISGDELEARLKAFARGELRKPRRRAKP